MISRISISQYDELDLNCSCTKWCLRYLRDNDTPTVLRSLLWTPGPSPYWMRRCYYRGSNPAWILTSPGFWHRMLINAAFQTHGQSWLTVGLRVEHFPICFSFNVHSSCWQYNLVSCPQNSSFLSHETRETTLTFRTYNLGRDRIRVIVWTLLTQAVPN